MGRFTTDKTAEDWPVTLQETIAIDCLDWMQRVNDGAMMESDLYLNVCSTSEESGLYQLILNGLELSHGTLDEINAVVKAMISMVDRKAEYFPWMEK